MRVSTPNIGLQRTSPCPLRPSGFGAHGGLAAEAGSFGATRMVLCLTLLCLTKSVFAEKAGVSIPAWNDDYSSFVKGLEAGKTDIDYRQFRESFLESKQFQVAGASRAEIDRLQASISPLIQQKKYSDLIDVTKRILSIDYTDMRAHKVLQQTYKIVGDSANQAKYHAIEFGLLNSIVQNGDGKSCATGWPVIQVKEEYFILDMLGAKIHEQRIDSSGGVCDRMEVETEDGKAVYYFDVKKVFEGYHRLGIK
jgi:hypothetical protein